jgi:hypothetical protein
VAQVVDWEAAAAAGPAARPFSVMAKAAKALVHRDVEVPVGAWAPAAVVVVASAVWAVAAA